MINQWFFTMLEVSITTGLVILILKMLSFLINKNYAAKWKKWIWLLIAVRLLVPLNLSIFGAPIQLIIPAQDEKNNFSYTSAANMNSDSAKGTIEKGNHEIKADTGVQTEGNVSGNHNSKNKITGLMIAALVWSVGGCIYLVYHLFGAWYYRKQILRWSRKAKEQRVAELVTQIAKQLDLKKQPEIYVCNKIESPALMGLFHPILILPGDWGSELELEFILRHELVHYRQKDIWYKLIFLLANAIHWFNPAVFLLRSEACNDLELACDDEVIKSMSATERIKYGETILSCINRQKLRNMALATGFNDSTKSLKERLKNICSQRKKRNGFIIIIISLILVVTIGALFSFNRDSNVHKQAAGLNWYGAVDLILENTDLPDHLIENYDDWNAFLESDKTIALVARIPEADISVYGLKENGTEAGVYTLKGIYVKQGNEVQVIDTNWGVYDELPEIRYQDYDGDGKKEIAVISRSASGTGLSVNDLYILKKRNSGGWTEQVFTSLDWSKLLNERLEYQVKDGSLTMTLDGKDTGYRIDAAALEEEWGEKITSVFFGSFGEFMFQEDKIYLKALPFASVGNWATPQSITDTYITLEVVYNGSFDLVNGVVQELTPTQALENVNHSDNEDINDSKSSESGSDNVNNEPEIVSDEFKVMADEKIQEYLNSPDGTALKETVEGFVKAYFSNDHEAAASYLSKDADYDSFVYSDEQGSEKDVYDKLSHLVAKWYTASEKEANVQYEYAVEKEDSFTYLNLDLSKEEGKWAISGIYLEK